MSLRALANDRYARITADKLPEAEIAVADAPRGGAAARTKAAFGSRR